MRQVFGTRTPAIVAVLAVILLVATAAVVEAVAGGSEAPVTATSPGHHDGVDPDSGVGPDSDGGLGNGHGLGHAFGHLKDHGDRDGDGDREGDGSAGPGGPAFLPPGLLFKACSHAPEGLLPPPFQQQTGPAPSLPPSLPPQLLTPQEKRHLQGVPKSLRQLRKLSRSLMSTPRQTIPGTIPLPTQVGPLCAAARPFRSGPPDVHPADPGR